MIWSVWDLLMATIKRAGQLELTHLETAECIRTVYRDHGRRTGRLRDRRQPGPPCTLVPCSGVRIDVLGKRGSVFAYHMRREPVTSGPGTGLARPREP